MPDSITNNTVAADSAAPVYYAPQYSDGFPQPQPGDTAIASVTTLPVMEVPQGSDSATPPGTPLRDTGTMSLILAALFLVVVSYRTGYKYIEQMAHNLLSVRRRENAFEDHTVNETQILTTLTVNTCVMMGVACYYGLLTWVPSMSSKLQGAVFVHTAMLSGIAMVFYLLQLLVYNIVGQVFADGVATKLWTDGFKASHSLLGILLVPVVGATMVWPGMCKDLLICAIIIYFCCRITFIFKGFRIFYSNIPSIVYFILYLCSVEIVPLVLLGAGTIYLCKII